MNQFTELLDQIEPDTATTRLFFQFSEALNMIAGWPSTQDRLRSEMSDYALGLADCAFEIRAGLIAPPTNRWDFRFLLIGQYLNRLSYTPGLGPPARQLVMQMQQRLLHAAQSLDPTHEGEP